jgi:hypothetical protein
LEQTGDWIDLYERTAKIDKDAKHAKGHDEIPSGGKMRMQSSAQIPTGLAAIVLIPAWRAWRAWRPWRRIAT